MRQSQTELFPKASGSTAGLYCCAQFFPWKDLGVHIYIDEWEWSCPKCHVIIRVDAFNPPSDLPEDLRVHFVERESVR